MKTNNLSALIHGGPLDGRTIDLTENLQELRLEDTSSGRLVIHRYIFLHTDEDGVRHYVTPFKWPQSL